MKNIADLGGENKETLINPFDEKAKIPLADYNGFIFLFILFSIPNELKPEKTCQFPHVLLH